VDVTGNAAAFTKTNLSRYDAVIFLNAIGDILEPAQQDAFREYIESGGGLAAVHAAIPWPRPPRRPWPWYENVIGTTFLDHTPAAVPGIIDVEDTNNPSTASLPARWPHREEWYFFATNPRGKVHVLMTVEEASFLRTVFNTDHPIAWRRDAGKGRVWYTALGHDDSCYIEPLFLRHLLGGIEDAAGKMAAPAAEPTHLPLAAPPK
jgi:type 1 glutamine amidotransferase